MFANGFGMKKGARATRRGITSLIGIALLVVAVVSPVSASMAVSGVKTRTDVSQATVSGEPADAAVADFNGDRHLDIVQAISGGGLTVRWGVSKGVYSDPVAIDAPTVKGTRVLGVDVTADGIADVVAWSPGGKTVWVVPAGGEHGFLATRTTMVDQGVLSVATGDFDRNGGVDLVVAAARANALVFLMTRDNRSGFDVVTTAVDFAPVSVASVALDRGGYTDLVVGTRDKTLVTMMNVAGSFQRAASKSVGFEPAHLATVDLNADGHADVVAGSTLGNIATCLWTDKGIADPVDSGVQGALGRMTIGYADDDSRPDIIGSGAGVAIVYQGLEGGLFSAPREAVRFSDVTAVAVAP
ncbi:MAG TPA: VCBS repeat-containing protein, partial [Blastocatellia bacterium]|nr:VCBS repeat-containing protein [Blastocatellia bacterium]